MHIVTVPRPLYTLNSLIPKNKFKMTLSDSDSDCSSSSDDESTGGLGSFMARQQARKNTLHQFEGFEDDDEGTVADQMRAVLALRASLGIDNDLQFLKEQEEKEVERKRLEAMTPEERMKYEESKAGDVMAKIKERHAQKAAELAEKKKQEEEERRKYELEAEAKRKAEEEAKAKELAEQEAAKPQEEPAPGTPERKKKTKKKVGEGVDKTKVRKKKEEVAGEEKKKVKKKKPKEGADSSSPESSEKKKKKKPKEGETGATETKVKKKSSSRDKEGKDGVVKKKKKKKPEA